MRRRGGDVVPVGVLLDVRRRRELADVAAGRRQAPVPRRGGVQGSRCFALSNARQRHGAGDDGRRHLDVRRQRPRAQLNGIACAPGGPCVVAGQVRSAGVLLVSTSGLAAIGGDGQSSSRRAVAAAPASSGGAVNAVVVHLQHVDSDTRVAWAARCRPWCSAPCSCWPGAARRVPVAALQPHLRGEPRADPSVVGTTAAVDPHDAATGQQTRALHGAAGLLRRGGGRRGAGNPARPGCRLQQTERGAVLGDRPVAGCSRSRSARRSPPRTVAARGRDTRWALRALPSGLVVAAVVRAGVTRGQLPAGLPVRDHRRHRVRGRAAPARRGSPRGARRRR